MKNRLGLPLSDAEMLSGFAKNTGPTPSSGNTIEAVPIAVTPTIIASSLPMKLDFASAPPAFGIAGQTTTAMQDEMSAFCGSGQLLEGGSERMTGIKV